MAPVPSTRNYNKDAQVFQSQNGQDYISLDFAKNRFKHTWGRDQYFSNLDKEYLERGDFYYVTGHHVLWVLKAAVDIPQSWNSDKTGITDQTPVVIFFFKGEKVYTVTFGQLSISKPVTIENKDELVQRWNVGVDVFIPTKTMQTSTAAFIPKLTISYYDDQKKEMPQKVVINIMGGQILNAKEQQIQANPKSAIIKSTADQVSDSMKPFQDYNLKFEAIQNWYKKEVQKLNTKASKMRDKELNQAVEKLTADYNRKLIHLQSEAPTTGGEVPKNSPPISIQKKQPK
ncbi:MAG: hypothetical protein H7328_11945 [Bdellovibrio sp.]|nr:hypothetical protein [Bdellovibrio sp.]